MISEVVFALIVLIFDGGILGTVQGDVSSSWKETCTPGNCQSPINIDHRKVIWDKGRDVVRSDINLTNYGFMEMTVQNNGISVVFTPRDKAQTLPILSGGPMRQDYVFHSFHFHRYSEHTIDSKEYPFEFHIIHHKANMTLEEAKSQRDGLMVFAILCEKKDSGDDKPWALAQLMAAVLKVPKPGAKHHAGVINIGKLLPDMSRYYTYLGSLTTPSYDEAVVWIVFKQHIPVTRMQSTVLSAVRYDDGEVENNRGIQSSRNRKIYSGVTRED